MVSLPLTSSEAQTRSPMGMGSGGAVSFATGLKTIVVATDLKGQSEAAMEYARKLASAYGARLVLAHGLDPVEYAAVGSVPGRVRDELTEEAKNALDALAGELVREGIRSHTEIRQGAIAQLLLDAAQQYEAGLIVLGTKGLDGAGPVLVGAVAEQVVRQATCPVLAVAADWNAGAFRPTPGGPVLLAVERNEATAAAVATAYSLAQTFERPLLVLHARQDGGDPSLSDPCAVTMEEFGIQSSERVPVHCMVEEGEPEDAIAQAIATHGPCILVAGVKRASETPGPHGTAFALLARSRVPVLCVPPETGAGGPGSESCRPAETD
jgi:nucleotide-binding universal stress UspA family protein